MNISMPEGKGIAKAVKEIGKSKVNGNFDVGMSVVPEQGGKALKSAHLHCKCSVPVLKIALIVAGGILALALHLIILKKKKCCCD